MMPKLNNTILKARHMVTKKKDFSGKDRPSFQATGQIFFGILPIGMNCLHFLHPSCKIHLPFKQICVTAGESTAIMEKTDTRIVVHILHALNQSMKSVMVHTVNTNIILNIVGDSCNTAFSGWVAPGTWTDCVVSTQFVIPSVQK